MQYLTLSFNVQQFSFKIKDFFPLDINNEDNVKWVRKGQNESLFVLNITKKFYFSLPWKLPHIVNSLFHSKWFLFVSLRPFHFICFAQLYKRYDLKFNILKMTNNALYKLETKSTNGGTNFLAPGADSAPPQSFAN